MELFVCYLLAMLTAAFLQRLTTQKHAKDFLAADLFALYVGAFLQSLFLVLTIRPLIALLLSTLVLFVLAVTNWAKQKALRDEPLFFLDITLAKQVFLFPWLYLPYLPYKTILACLGFLCLTIFFIWDLAKVQVCILSYILLLPVLFIFLATRFSSWQNCVRRILDLFPLKFSRDDVASYGPLGAAILHTLWHIFKRGQKNPDQVTGILESSHEPYAKLAWDANLLADFSQRPKLPNLLLIQEESFADPRLFNLAIPKEVLANFDRLSLNGYRAELAVRAYGAYTMRTEYEVLTGISAQYLGTDAFHPYFSAAKIPSWSIANFLRSQGYYTVCVHPFARSFFYRDLALPKMGFDLFLSQENFPIQEKFGPYISDLSVAKVILNLLQDQKRPVFCFVITMENHGPWLEDRLVHCPKEDVLHLPDLEPRISRYLTHIKNADNMLALLACGLKRLPVKSFLAIYGDHLPGISTLIPSDVRDTPCLLWGTETTYEQLAKLYEGQKIIAPAELGGFLLKGALSQG